jgi:hypothetical protein
MRALPLLILALLLACRASALEPLVRIVLPETITSDLAHATTLRPEVELTNRGAKPLTYRVYGPENQPIWAGVITFELRYGFGTKISALWEPLSDHFGSRSLTLPSGTTVRLRYCRPLTAKLRFPGNYRLTGSTRLQDETGEWQAAAAEPATFTLEDKPHEMVSPKEVSSEPTR